MKKTLISIAIVSLVVIGGTVGVLNIFCEKAMGTNVSGTVYDGAGGPWTVKGSPYIVVGDIFVPSGQTLTIDSGVEVKFNGFYSIYVDGTLTAVGTDVDRIQMTSNLGSPGHGDWDRIQINSLGHAEIAYCDISCGTYGLYLDYSSNNIITQNNIVSNNYYGIYLDYSTGNDIINNYVSDNTQGIRLDNSDNNNITYNTVYMNMHTASLPNGTMEKEGIRIWYSDLNEVVGNFVSFSEAGIIIGYSSGNIVDGNNISYNINGLNIYQSDSTLVANNTAYYNSGDCFWIYSSSANNDIYDNVISLNDGRGLWLDWTTNNDIQGNTISDNGLDGIRLSTSTGNTITENTISYNDWGFILAGSTGNLIYHNSIIDNGLQAYDDSNNKNQWDYGYPIGGNYWSDYTGSDGNGDGIGDTPYVIDSNSQDNYPLMEPFDNGEGNSESSIKLLEGWNLVSVPLEQSNTDISSVLSSIAGYYDVVQWFCSYDSSDPWKNLHTSKPISMNDLTDIDHKRGVLIHITESNSALLQCSGHEFTENQKINLYSGWNLVGYPSLTKYNRTEGLNNLTFGNQVDAIWSYNGTAHIWEEIGENDCFQTGRGYYIHAKTECNWVVPL